MKRQIPHAYPARAIGQRRIDGRTLRWAAIRIPRPGGRERYARTCASLAGCQRIIDNLKQALSSSATNRRALKNPKQESAMEIGDKPPGTEISPGTFFLGWNVLERRGERGIKCPACKGYAGEAECTPEEIRSDMNCGCPYACCVAAFQCEVCGKRWVGNKPAPEVR